MISFYPGPSKLNPQVKTYIEEALQLNILSYNHRNKEFLKIIDNTYHALREKLNVPNDYEIYFVNSATACWHIVANAYSNLESTHYYNGAFGEKWFQTSTNLVAQAFSIEFSVIESLPIQKVESNEGVICITQCETSNGSLVSDDTIQKIKTLNLNHLIAVDATSGMGGLATDFTVADIWFASVQKCFGLPAGLGLMICSPNAVAKAKSENTDKNYNSINNLHAMYLKGQTVNTPNMLGIFLLSKVLNDSLVMATINKRLVAQHTILNEYFKENMIFKPLIIDKILASPTLIALLGDEKEIEKLKTKALQAGFLLGNGYGKWAKNTFRIANFPAHTIEDINQLLQFFKTNYQ